MKLFFKVTLLTVLTTLLVGYFSFVYNASAIMTEVLSSSSKVLKNKGFNFEYDVSDHKFSFVPYVLLKNVRLSFQNPDKITAVEFNQLKITFNPFHMAEIKIIPQDTARVITFNSEYELTFKNISLSFKYDTDVILSDISATVNDLTVMVDDKKEVSVKNIMLSLNKMSSGYGIDINTNKVLIGSYFIDGFYADIFLNQKLDFGLGLSKMWQDYRDRGGVIAVNKMSLGWEKMRFIGDGSVFFDDNMEINALLPVHVFGFDEGLSSLEEKHIISKKERWMSKVILYSLAKTTENHESFIPTEIIVKNGGLYVGPILFYTFDK